MLSVNEQSVIHLLRTGRLPSTRRLFSGGKGLLILIPIDAVLRVKREREEGSQGYAAP